MDSRDTRRYTAKMDEVKSGDDISMMVDLGVSSLYQLVRCRLYRIDTPDTFRSEDGSDAKRVQKWVYNFLKDRECTVFVHSMRKSSWIVTILVHVDGKGTVDLNKQLSEQGYSYLAPLGDK